MGHSVHPIELRLGISTFWNNKSVSRYLTYFDSIYCNYFIEIYLKNMFLSKFFRSLGIYYSHHIFYGSLKSVWIRVFFYNSFFESVKLQWKFIKKKRVIYNKKHGNKPLFFSSEKIICGKTCACVKICFQNEGALVKKNIKRTLYKFTQTAHNLNIKKILVFFKKFYALSVSNYSKIYYSLTKKNIFFFKSKRYFLKQMRFFMKSVLSFQFRALSRSLIFERQAGTSIFFWLFRLYLISIKAYTNEFTRTRAFRTLSYLKYMTGSSSNKVVSNKPFSLSALYYLSKKKRNFLIDYFFKKKRYGFLIKKNTFVRIFKRRPLRHFFFKSKTKNNRFRLHSLRYRLGLIFRLYKLKDQLSILPKLNFNGLKLTNLFYVKNSSNFKNLSYMPLQYHSNFFTKFYDSDAVILTRFKC